METIHQRLRAYRKAKGFTIAEVAIKTGIPASTYKEWENGRQIRGEPYQNLAEVFQVSLHELITGKQKSDVRMLERLAQIENEINSVRKELITFF